MFTSVHGQLEMRSDHYKAQNMKTNKGTDEISYNPKNWFFMLS